MWHYSNGGVISPVLSNVFLHYVFDAWMAKNYPKIPWCRYADDALTHCKTEREAQQLLVVLNQRFKECGLELTSGEDESCLLQRWETQGRISKHRIQLSGILLSPTLGQKQRKK